VRGEGTSKSRGVVEGSRARNSFEGRSIEASNLHGATAGQTAVLPKATLPRRCKISLPAGTCARSCHGSTRSSGSPRRRRAEKVEEVTDAALSADLVAQGQVALDVVAVAPAVPLLHHVAGLTEIGHDPVRGPLGDGKPRREIAQSSVRMVRKEEHRPGVGRQKAPVGHTYQ
jgi:hypothetical protein